MKDMRIGVGLNFYQDFDSLRRLLTSLQCCAFDLLIAVDGKYKEWPNQDDPPYSDEACYDLLCSFWPQLEVQLLAAEDMTQNQKRQIYMDEAEKHDLDAIIVLDSDEYIICEHTDYQLFKQDLERKITNNQTYRKAYCVPCKMWDQWPHPNLDGQLQNIPRVYVHPWTMRYAENHFTIRDKRTGICQTFEGAPICQHIMMANDHKLRELRYQETSTTYSKALLEWEKEGRYR
jgi:hypothetical protein